MRSHSSSQLTISEIRRSLDRLDRLPIRPTTALLLLERAEHEFEEGSARPAPAESPRRPDPRRLDPVALDPGWVLARASIEERDRRADLRLVSELKWWKSVGARETAALEQLRRHAIAYASAVRRVASESNDPDPDALATSALLADLGLWAWAAVDPCGFADWIEEPLPARRAEIERARLGSDHLMLSIRLMERWGCPRTVSDAHWALHCAKSVDPGPLDSVDGSASERHRFAILANAAELAETTPWRIDGRGRRASTGSPQSRLLIAEVQARTAGPFVDPQITPREERLVRRNAALLLELEEAERTRASAARFLEAFNSSAPLQRPEVWTEQSGRAWCDEPGVSAARVVWAGSASDGPADSPRAPHSVIPLRRHGRTLAEIQLWTESNASIVPDAMVTAAWSRWAEEVAAGQRLGLRLSSALELRHEAAGREDRAPELSALAEFAAGAGHELNNPLAVIVGRAQLLLTKQTDPGDSRSLRTIISQAQRTSRILRDLMFVSRPPMPRPKLCQPDAILENSIRDLQSEAEARSVRISLELEEESAARAWVDPDSLRHIADSLLRNAIEATPGGGRVVVKSRGTAERLDWTIEDEGRGLDEREATHLFDPFFCGRQAGRGLGLGLPRVARIIERSRGDLTWHSDAGRGSTFRVTLPLDEPPPAPSTTKPEEATRSGWNPESRSGEEIDIKSRACG
ncbi:MAG: ATP-binding protein [Isosphaeraceae bacterium]|nr:ATP-binding protein [Isosphaeraceae bacterium]